MFEREPQNNLNDRRSFLKLLAAAPLFATIGTRNLAAAVASTARAATTGSGHSFANNLYTRLGVRPFINARGTWTYLSGSLELPPVRKAAEEASHYFVDMYELQAAAGAHLAKLSGAEDGMVTSGSAGAMASAAAGCMAGTDPKKIYQLPDTTGMKGEVVMIGGRSAFDSAIRLTGAKIVLAPTVDDLQSAITSQTAMVYTTLRDERLTKVLTITRAAGVPLMVDGAGGAPPFKNLGYFSKMGVDLYSFSGGKGLFGPQASGLLLGRKDLITAAKYNSSPWEGAVCRPMKVGKEEIMGILAAVDFWSDPVREARTYETWRTWGNRIARLVETVPGVTTDTVEHSYPILTVSWDEKKFGLTVAECDQQLRAGEPRIEVLTASNPSGVLARLNTNRSEGGSRPNHLQITSFTLQPGEDLIVGNRLRQILDKARKQSA